MDFLKFLTFSFCLFSIAHAGIFRCDDINGKPEDTLRVPSKLIPHTSEPFLVPNAVARAEQFNLKPFLIYYVIDPDEPFMQYAVDFEVANLEKSCLASDDVNFAVFRNSLYLSSNEFIYCKDRKLTRFNISTIPSLDSDLKKKLQIIRDADHTTEDRGPWINFPVSYSNAVNASFAKYPLAHPDFLYELVKILINEDIFFPSDEYIPFLNLKSHGTKDYVLSGLHPCQLQAKNDAQKDFIKNTLSPVQKSALKNPEMESPEFNEAIDSLLLGSKLGVGSFPERLNAFGLNAYGLNAYGLNAYGLNAYGLGPIGGLGDGHGLKAEFAFGTYHVAVNAVLRELFNEKNGKVMGFVMFEACDTNRDPVFNHTVLDNTLGFYSAKHSLWYRNLNWWTLLEASKGSAGNLLKNLEAETKLIPNLEIIE